MERWTVFYSRVVLLITGRCDSDHLTPVFISMDDVARSNIKSPVYKRIASVLFLHGRRCAVFFTLVNFTPLVGPAQCKFQDISREDRLSSIRSIVQHARRAEHAVSLAYVGIAPPPLASGY